MPDTYINSGGNLRQMKEIFVNDGGILRDCQQVWVNDTGTLRLVFEKVIPPASKIGMTTTTWNVADTAINPNNAAIQITFGADGYIEVVDALLNVKAAEEWNTEYPTPSDPENYELTYSITGEHAEVVPASNPSDLDSNRVITFRATQTPSGELSSQCTVTVTNKNDPLDTVTKVINVSVEKFE